MDVATGKYNRRYYLADCAGVIADGRGCEMQELGELVDGE